MTVSSPVHRLFAVTHEGPQPLEVPSRVDDPGQVFDRLPLGVYEAARTFDGHLFVGLTEHLDRMERSIALAGIEGPFERARLTSALDAIVREFPGDSKVRFDVLRGPATELGSEASVVVQATSLALPPDEVYRDGVRCQLSRLRREQPAVKEAQWVVDRRVAQGGSPENFESILVDEDGCLLEGTQSNFFWVRAGELRTAPADRVLAGVTRGFVLELAGGLGIPVLEEAAHVDALDDLDEGFFTTSVRSVIPVVAVADQALGDGRPGPVTRELMEAYTAFCARSARPAVDA